MWINHLVNFEEKYKIEINQILPLSIALKLTDEFHN